MMVLGARDLPNMTLEQFRTQIILSRGALYDLIFRSSGSTLDMKSQGKGQRGSGKPCCASFRKRRPLSPTGGMSRWSSLTHP